MPDPDQVSLLPIYLADAKAKMMQGAAMFAVGVIIVSIGGLGPLAIIMAGGGAALFVYGLSLWIKWSAKARP